MEFRGSEFKLNKKAIKKTFVCLLIVVAMLFEGIPGGQTFAKGSIIPKAIKNTYNSRMKYSALEATSTGYVRICMESYDWDGNIYIENYDNNFNIVSRKTLAAELPVYGGFYSSNDAYYFVFGKNNLEEDDNAEVVRVVKYSKNWTRLGACSIKSGSDDSFSQVRYPFDGFGVSILEVNGKLYVATAHEGYVDPQFNMGHTGFYMLQIDTKTMTGGVVDYNLWHSFSQHLAAKDKDNIFVLEESEGSRCTILSKLTEDKPYRNQYVIPLEYGGSRTSAWAIATGATADAVEVAGNNVIAVGTSIDQSRYDDETYNPTYNIYMSVTPINNFTDEATTFKWFTNDNAKNYYGVKLIRINDNRLMLMWEKNEDSQTIDGDDILSSGRLHYAFIDAQGNKISKEFTANATISDCNLTLKNGKVSFFASEDSVVDFYSIDASTGAFSKKCYNIAGENCIWKVENGILKISGTGKIRDNLSSSLRGLDIKGLEISNGITEIGQSAFSGIKDLKSVVIPKSVKVIGDSAFSYIYDLRDIYIPDSVKEMGEDTFHTGYYWIGGGGKVYRVKIHCNKGSYAEKYAKKYGIIVDNSGYNTFPGAAEKDPDNVTKTDREPKNAEYSVLQAKAVKVTNSSVKLTWKKVPGARKYYIYANRNGKGKKFKKLTNTTKTKYTAKKVAGKKLAGGTYYKFIVVAVDNYGDVISISKTVFASTSGGTKGNYKKVTTKAKKNKVNIKAGKTFKLRAKAVASPKSVKVKKCRGICYESTNSNIVKVNKKGVIKGVNKGTCYVYAYAQNGVAAKIKVTVK
ncbi:MAG: leucine-rich repeat domain-containing protein [Eubacterium sp.]|nr:leucine-rich repeat domain-containing protein [Eubacterium sp.]